jgi:uncharacterized protein
VFDIYFPIAEVTLSAPLVVFLGLLGGLASGLFGIGGGFLLTPLLIGVGVSPAVAVGTQANQLIASSLTGTMHHWRRGTVDVRMGFCLLAGSVVGAWLGVGWFEHLGRLGLVDMAVSLLYVSVLGAVGLFMLRDVLQERRARITGRPLAVKSGRGRFLRLLHWLPFKMRFPKSRLCISVLGPVLLGVVIGALVSLLGIGGGFVLIPAMIYILGMPGSLVVGTSLFQMVATASVATVMHATVNNSVDVLLALVLLAGGVTGSHLGSRLGQRLPNEKLRLGLAILVLALCMKMLATLLIPPTSLYRWEEIPP